MAVRQFDQASSLHRVMRRLAATTPVAWLFARGLNRLDTAVHRLSGGRLTFAGVASGIPVMMLTSTGARTGARRTTPVLGVADGDSVIVIASNFGQARHPAWAHNLRRHPDASIEVDGVVREVRARELVGEERERAFERGLAVYPGYAAYRRRAGRTIRVYRLEPR